MAEISEFRTVESKVEVRAGSKAPWIEVRVTSADGGVKKYVMKKVEAFYSDRQGSVDELR